ncbi:MAG TPA: hypothetical protein VJ957_01445 [Longimicrobiales bacterium]|nr:hypothetical protein [Longimicrobiales bacterium]
MTRRVGGLAMVLSLALLVPGAARAQGLADYDYENLSFRGIGIDWGYIWPTKVHNAQAFGARVDLGYLGPGIRIVPSVQYWRSDFLDSELNTLAAQLNRQPFVSVAGPLGPVHWSDFSLNLDGQFVWSTPLHVLTYVGAGAGLHVLRGGGPAFDGTFVEDLLNSVTAGVDAMGGLEFRLGPRLRVYGEARYTVVINDVRYPWARVGLAVMLGRPKPNVVGLADTSAGRDR